MPPRVLYWHRTDLRLHDSPALVAALETKGLESFYPVWCFDPEYVWKHTVGVNRWQFLLQSMQDLSNSYTSLNPLQKLHVLRGSPFLVLPIILREWSITHVYYEKDTSGYGLRRDVEFLEMMARDFPDVKVETRVGHNLFDPEEVVKKHKGKPTMTLQQWKKASEDLGEVPRPLPVPLMIPSPGDVGFGSSSKGKGKGKGKAKLEDGPTAVLEGPNKNGEIMDLDSLDCFDSISGPNGLFSVPTLQSLGLPPATTTIAGGETQALARLEAFLSNPTKVATFSKPLTAPTSLEPSTTLLSPYIKFGCLSVREFWWRCKDSIRDDYKGKEKDKTKEPENIFGQLEFREMYYCAEFALGGAFDKIRGNGVCRFMNWGLENQYDKDGQLIIPRPRGNEIDEERFAAWKEGRTGFPWIDAVMRQLRIEGWIHHLARHSVACFLTRGQCYISWERGAEVFDEYLLDWDPCSNPGNWMWLSCSAFFSQYYRVYGLVSWPLKTDVHGTLVRKYCPELAGFPDKYIYAPHTASLAVQKASNCIIGQDYPFPMLDEKVEKEKCIARLKQAFSKGLHGDSPSVLDGTAHVELKYENVQEVKNEPKSPGKRKEMVQGPMDAFVNKKKKVE